MITIRNLIDEDKIFSSYGEADAIEEIKDKKYYDLDEMKRAFLAGEYYNSGDSNKDFEDFIKELNNPNTIPPINRYR